MESLYIASCLILNEIIVTLEDFKTILKPNGGGHLGIGMSMMHQWQHFKS